MATMLQDATIPRDGPLYARVAAALRDEIARGVHTPGAQLPPEDRLSARFAVSRYTVREALRRLRDEGLIASRRGAGTLVMPPRADAHVLRAMAIGDLVAFAADARLTLDSVTVETIDTATATRAGLVRGSEWLVCGGTRRAAGSDTALCVTEYFVHHRFAAIATPLVRHPGPVFALIEDRFAVRIAEVEQEIGAIAIEAGMADRLGVEPGTIGLEVRRTYRLGDGMIAQVTINTHPAARFRHSMTMRRARD